jgi:cation:H+ antiporter
MFFHLLIYALSFVGIWVGSGLAIRSVEQLSKTLKVSSFAVSFLVLGLFTSMSELSVGVNSIMENDPEIFVGNLIGASIVLLMLTVPLLAVVGNSIPIAREFRGFNLRGSLVVIALPVLLAMDGKLSTLDGIIAIVMFSILMLSVQTKRGVVEKMKGIRRPSIKVGKELAKVLFGVIVIFIASKFVVDKTLYFSEILGISPFLISLLLIAIGTNVPELSLVVRSVFMRNNQVAFGDYLGSASFNTLLAGVLTLAYGKPILLTNSYRVSLVFLVVGLLLFYYFARTKNTISRLEGLLLLIVYMAFLGTEIFLHRQVLPL